jgi:ADP-ribose pyrophosphatase
MEVNVLNSVYISEHRYFRARKDAYEMPSGKIVDPYFFVEVPPSVTAMALTADNQVILVEQYRHPIARKIIELPGGFIDEGENPDVAIARELLEETGYSFLQIIPVGITTGNPGVINNYTYLYLALGGQKTTEQHLDPNEEIDVVLKSVEEVRQMLLKSEFLQSIHALCMFQALAKLDAV